MPLLRPCCLLASVVLLVGCGTDSASERTGHDLVPSHEVENPDEATGGNGMGGSTVEVESDCPTSPQEDTNGDGVLDQIDYKATQVNIVGKDLSTLKCYTRIQGLYLYPVDDQILDLAPLAQLTQLQNLSLHQGSYENLDAIADVQIESLVINNIGIENFNFLGEQAKLTELFVTADQLTSLSTLPPLAALDTLQISSDKLTDASGLSGQVNLRDLSIDARSLKQLGLLEDLDKLESVFLVTPQLKSLDGLGGLPSLKHLWLHTVVFDLPGALVDLSDLANGCHLESLTFVANQVTSLEGVQACSKLKHLDAGFNKINDLTPLQNLNLVSLYLPSNEVTALDALQEMTSLEQLDLAENNIEDIGSLADLRRISYLKLDDNKISDVSALAELEELYYLVMNNNQVSDLSGLANLPLQFVSLANNRISDVSVFSQMKLTSLDLTQNEITTLPEYFSPLVSVSGAYSCSSLNLTGNPLESRAKTEILPQLCEELTGSFELSWSPHQSCGLCPEPGSLR